MSLLAALDLGTNSFHLVIARVSDDGHFEVITREKELVRLGHGGGDMKRLEPEALQRGIAALTRMRRLAESAGASLRAVATSAVREAENSDEFLDAARTQAGVGVEVISGVEEARLIHLGVLQAVPVSTERPGPTWKPGRCWPTSDFSSPTASTISTATTSSAMPSR